MRFTAGRASVIQFGPVIDFNANFGRSGQYGFHYLGWLQPVLDQYVTSRETKYRDDFIAVTKQYYDQRARPQAPALS